MGRLVSGRQVKALRRLYSSKAARRADAEFEQLARRKLAEVNAELDQPIERRDARRIVLAIVCLAIIAALLAQVALGVLT